MTNEHRLSLTSSRKVNPSDEWQVNNRPNSGSTVSGTSQRFRTSGSSDTAEGPRGERNYVSLSLARVNGLNALTVLEQKRKMIGWTIFFFVITFLLLFVLIGVHAYGYHNIRTVQKTIEFNAELANVINELQIERDLVITYISIPTTAADNRRTNQYHASDQIVKNLSGWRTWQMKTAPLVHLQSADNLLKYVNAHRFESDVEDSSQQRELVFYSQLITDIITWFTDVISEQNTGAVWKFIVALNEAVMCNEMLALERGYGLLYFINGRFSNMADYKSFIVAQDVANDSLIVAGIFYEMLEEKFDEAVHSMGQLTSSLDRMRHRARRDPFGRDPSIERLHDGSASWHGNMTLYINRLSLIQNNITSESLTLLGDEISAEHRYLLILMAVMCGILVILPLTMKVVQLIVFGMKAQSDALMWHTTSKKLVEERTNNLFHVMLPKQIATELNVNKNVNSELFDQVTVFFSEMADFTNICSRLSAQDVVILLNMMYNCVDGAIRIHDVYRVEVLADTYMIASGLPNKNGRRHAEEIASMALSINNRIKNTEPSIIHHSRLSLKMGIHSGRVVAGIVGNAMPRYCLFGKTIKTASRMKSTSVGGRIQISQATKDVLPEIRGFSTERREDAAVRMSDWEQLRRFL
ncbi:hypothetical protein LSH36_246g04040 [Paralvinella palmiformis]|uniref:Guanylate cyclase domain-containing protein n=1 Tax=Paralvinella palmiformis TaxID=53620 RepID=A0AAD9N4K7_9ANNE|nr:hypothetical protein LSH36_246g04040 [Paralvinella palmiformis]